MRIPGGVRASPTASSRHADCHHVNVSPHTSLLGNTERFRSGGPLEELWCLCGLSSDMPPQLSEFSAFKIVVFMFPLSEFLTLESNLLVLIKNDISKPTTSEHDNTIRQSTTKDTRLLVAENADDKEKSGTKYHKQYSRRDKQ